MYNYYDTRLKKGLNTYHAHKISTDNAVLKSVGIYPVLNKMAYDDKTHKLLGYEYSDIINDEFVAYEAITESLPAEKVLEYQKQDKLAKINEEYTKAVSITRIGIPEDEILTWDIQKLEAQAWQINNNNTTPFIDKLLETRNSSRESRGLIPFTRVEFMSKVLEKAEAYKMLVGAMSGKRQGLEDAINAVTSSTELEGIVWED